MTVYTPDGSPVAAELYYYNAAGLLWETIDAAGNDIFLTYDAAGRVTRRDVYGDGGSHVWEEFAYDTAGNQFRSASSGGSVVRTFDAVGRVTGETIYNADNSVFTQSTTVWLENGTSVTTDALGNKTYVTRNAEGRVLSESIVSPTFETVFTVTHLYNDAGHLILTTDGVGNLTEYLRDGAGRATREVVKTPSGVIASWREWFYNLENELVWAKTGNDSFTWYEYDAAGNVTKETVKNAAGQVVTWRDNVYYPGSGLLWKTYDANGNYTVYIYNGAGQVVSEKTWDVTLGTFISDKLYEYDGGLVSAVVNVGVNRTEWTYNGAGQKTSEKVFDANGQLDAAVYFAYDSAGNLDTVTDGANRVTKYVYNGAGLKESETVGFGTPKAATTYYDYDAAGRLLAVTDPEDNTTYFGYDAAGRETSMTDPFGYTVWKTYDDAGRLTSLTNRRNQQIVYGHDAAGRTTGETWLAPDGVTVIGGASFQFDWAGNMVGAANAIGAYTMTPNAAGWVTHVTAPFNVTLDFGYDNAGNRTSVTDSFGGMAISQYDALGNLHMRELTAPYHDTLKVTQLFNGAGQRTATQRHVNGFVTSSTVYVPDGTGRAEGITHFDAFNIPQVGYAYSYNSAGDMLSKTDHGVVKNYAYDEHGQLTNDNGTGYSYDLNGNRTNPGYVTGAGNRIAADGTWNYSYDADGNITKKVRISDGLTWEYSYDVKNHLTSAIRRTTDGGPIELPSVSYLYDAFGNRIAKYLYWTPPALLIFKYTLDGWNPAKAGAIGNENWDILFEQEGGVPFVRYLHGDVVDEIFAREEGGFEYWYWNDSQGSMREVVDASGLIKDAIEYDAFGNIVAETAPAYRGRYAWTGRELDEHTGLQHNRDRVYDAAIGRWMSQDPLGFAAGDANLYRYVGNRSNVATDPSGLEEFIPRADRNGNTQLFVVREFLWFNRTSTERWVGILRPDGRVERDGRTATRGAVETAGYEDDWDAWFEENGSEINPSPVVMPDRVTSSSDGYVALDPNFHQRGPQARNLVVAGAIWVIIDTGLPGPVARITTRAVGRVAQTAVRTAVRRAELALARRVFQVGSMQAARAAARNGDEFLPGLFRYNPRNPIHGYQQHHLWPRAMGGPTEGWIVYARGVVGNSHVEREAIQNRTNVFLRERTGIAGQLDLEDWARRNPSRIVEHLRVFYALEGITFPY